MKWALALPLKKLEGIVIDLDEGFREKEARGAVTQMQKWRGRVLRKWRKTFRGGRGIIDSVAIWDPFSGHLDYVSCHENRLCKTSRDTWWSRARVPHLSLIHCSSQHHLGHSHASSPLLEGGTIQLSPGAGGAH